MQKNIQKFPDFLIKSTQGVGLSSAILLTPFTVNNFIQGRYLLGLFTLIILTLCAMSAYSCYRGRYHLGINLFGIAPTLMIAIAIALSQLGAAGSYWAALGVIAFYFILPEKPAWVANIIFIAVLAPISFNVLEPPIAMRFFAVLLGVSFFSFLSIHEIHKQHRQLKEQSITDPLTGLYNRLLLQSSLENAIHQQGRTGIDVALIMLDIDHFKKVNDQFGHDAGDFALKTIGGFLKDFFRTSDILFRIGGEEFLILIYNTDKANLLLLAERLRNDVEQLPLLPNRSITISIGIATFEPNMDWEQWMKQCDTNLYRAKHNGRNQVVA